MKKILVLILVLILSLSLVACSNTDPDLPNTPSSPRSPWGSNRPLGEETVFVV